MFEFVIVATSEPDQKIQEGLIVCEALIGLNELWFKAHPEDICALNEGKVMYDKENEAVLAHHQILRTAPALIEDGKGLCLEIVAFEVAAHRSMGLKADPHIFKKAHGIYHVQMKVNKGGRDRIRDVSLELEKKGFVMTPACGVK